MKYMPKMPLLLFIFLLPLFTLWGEEKEIDVSQELRIHQLIPPDQLSVHLAIEPAVPANFVALSPDGKIDWSEGVYWGPEDVLRAYFKDKKSLKEPIIRIKLSHNVVQKGETLVDEQDLAENKKLFKNFSYSRGKWGEYPYFHSRGEMNGRTLILGWVGLNASGGTVFLFQLFYPGDHSGKPPTAQALALWNKFFSESKQLPEPLFLKAHGQEMHLGYTIVTLAGTKTKVIAERRKSDQKVQISLIPLDPYTEFKFDKAFDGNMGGKWKTGAPVAKLSGTFNINKDHTRITWDHTTTIFIQEVPEFSKIPILKKGVFVHRL